MSWEWEECHNSVWRFWFYFDHNQGLKLNLLPLNRLSLTTWLIHALIWNISPVCTHRLCHNLWNENSFINIASFKLLSIHIPFKIGFIVLLLVEITLICISEVYNARITANLLWHQVYIWVTICWDHGWCPRILCPLNIFWRNLVLRWIEWWSRSKFLL